MPNAEQPDCTEPGDNASVSDRTPLGAESVSRTVDGDTHMEGYLEFYNEALNSGKVFTFSVAGDYPSETIGKGGLVWTFLFWSSASRALSYRDRKQVFLDSELIEIPLEEFCTTTLESLRSRGHIVTVALNDSGEPGGTVYNRGIDGLRGYLDHFRLHKSEPRPYPGFWGGKHEPES